MARFRWCSRTWLAIASVAAAVTAAGGAACSKFDEADSLATEGGVGDGGAESSNEAAAQDSAAATDVCRTKEFGAPVFVPSSKALKSFRLDTGGTAWVSATAIPADYKAIAFTTFTSTGGPGPIASFLLESGSSDAEQAMLTPGRLELVFQSNRAKFLDAGSAAPDKLYVATRPVDTEPFKVATYLKVATISEIDPTAVQDPFIVGTHLYSVTVPPTGPRGLVVGDLDIKARMVSNVTNVYANPNDAEHPVVSGDERQLFYSVEVNALDTIHVATRASSKDPFPPGSIVAELKGDADAKPAWLSPDGCDLYYFTKIGDNEGLFHTTRRP